MLDGISMVNLKPTIDYNNILIKAQFINIVAVSDNGTHLETHSVRLACIKDSERYYIKTHGSESRGQEEAACTRVFWPTRPLQ